MASAGSPDGEWEPLMVVGAGVELPSHRATSLPVGCRGGRLYFSNSLGFLSDQDRIMSPRLQIRRNLQVQSRHLPAWNSTVLSLCAHCPIRFCSHTPLMISLSRFRCSKCEFKTGESKSSSPPTPFRSSSHPCWFCLPQFYFASRVSPPSSWPPALSAAPHSPSFLLEPTFQPPLEDQGP